MKFAPKNARFCPGCPKKELKLTTMATLQLSPLPQKDTKTITIVKSNQNKGKTFNLF